MSETLPVVAVMTASSNSGEACVESLLAAASDNQAYHVRAVFRTQDKADAFSSKEIASDSKQKDGLLSVVVGPDAADKDSLKGAFENASVAVIVTPMSGDFAKDAELTLNMINVAVETCGVDHVVYVGSWTVLQPDKVSMIASRFIPAEDRLKELQQARDSFSWTSLRSGYFMTNYAHVFSQQLKDPANTTIRFPEVHLPACDPRDIGRVAAKVATDMVSTTPSSDHQQHQNVSYDISGPAMLSTQDVITAIGKHLQRPLTHEPIPVSALEAVLPPFLYELMVYLEAAGKDAVPLSSDVQDIVGHTISLDEWLSHNLHLFPQ